MPLRIGFAGIVLCLHALAAAAQGPLAPSAEALAVQDAVVAAIERSERSVVAIQGTRMPEATRLVVPPDRFGPLRPADPGDGIVEHLQGEFGTGVILDASGLILTHYEVIRGVDTLEVTTAERRSYPARIVGADERSGLAVLSIDASGLPAIRLGDAKQLRKGQFVVALGNPYGIAADGQASASFGIVANLGRKSTVAIRREAAATLGELGWLIQTDAKLNLGTSGGALVNLRGELVGLTTSVAATAGYDQAAGYAIPIDDAFRRIVQTLRQGREVEYGLLGVLLYGDGSSVLADGSRGARVREVMPGAPADRAGLKAGDVIMEVAGAPIYSSDTLMLAVSQQPPLSATQLHYIRDGREHSARVELAKAQPLGEQIITAPLAAWRGLRVDFATAVEGYAAAASQEGTDVRGCVAVRHVEPHSPAWKAGIRVGTFISHVAHRQVRSPDEFYTAAQRQSGEVTLRIPLPRNESQQLTVKES